MGIPKFKLNNEDFVGDIHEKEKKFSENNSKNFYDVVILCAKMYLNIDPFTMSKKILEVLGHVDNTEEVLIIKSIAHSYIGNYEESIKLATPLLEYKGKNDVWVVGLISSIFFCV